ncbi:uncharacterized protein LOC6639268 [Drosophila willistoni]|nr:uncharacterized protein LOC6639268 [Drosophila willistoni]
MLQSENSRCIASKMPASKSREHNLFAYTVALIVVWLSIMNGLTAETTSVSPSTSSNRPSDPVMKPEQKHERNCKALCEHCGCLGFYCGEECLCECNNENSDTECIKTMQTNARTLNTPFEILIQGPSSNRFVRNAEQFDQKKTMEARFKTPRNRRSTITIYKPLKGLALLANAVEIPSAKKSDAVRHKRSVDHLEWFNDFANTLVRPSPLGTRAQRQLEAKPAAVEPVLPLTRREPWFLEKNPPTLTRPAPFKSKSRKSKKSSRRITKVSSIEDDSPHPQKTPEREIRPLRDALEVVERIPRVLQDTVSHLASDNNAGDVFSLNIMNDVYPSKATSRRKESPQKSRRPGRWDISFEPSRTKAPLVSAPAATPAPPAPLLPQRGILNLPWLRQRRLRRLQQQRQNN